MKRSATATFTLLVKVFFVSLVLFVSYLYIQITWYDFPEPEAFSGAHFYNPYQVPKKQWLKGNFHAHAYAWNGLTNGHQPGSEVQSLYRQLNYDVPCLTDYFAINNDQDKDDPAFIPAYEHGVNITKSHRLAIGSQEVYYYDLPLFQNLSIRQYLIERLRARTPVVAIAHPTLRNSHPIDMLSYLSGYQCMEIVNHHRIATRHWDAALSAGKPVWLLANDDVHHTDKADELAKAWTMIYANSNHKDNILQALAQGHTYAVMRKKPVANYAMLLESIWKKNHNVLKSLTMSGDTVNIQLTQAMDTIRVIGAYGELLDETYHTASASYHIASTAPYVRIEAEDVAYKYFFNPVVRYDGIKTPVNTIQASLDQPTTILWRMLLISVNMLLIFLLFRKYVLGLMAGHRIALQKKKRRCCGGAW